MLTIREVQQKTGLSYPAVKQRIDDGTVRAVKQGKKYLINEEDLHLLPKPRNTGMQQQHAIAETERSLQDRPFPQEMTGAQMIELKKWETLQMWARLAGVA